MMSVSLYISLFSMLIALFLSSLFLAFGPCYNGCDWSVYLYSSRFLLPFAVTLIVQFIAILRWHKTKSASKLHLIVIGLSGFIFIGLSLFAMVKDFGDAIIYVVFLILGLLIFQPAMVFRKKL